MNVTNAYAVQTTGAKPVLQQLGPYVYQKRSHYFNVALEISNSQFKYQSWTEYVAEPGNNAATDSIITINPVYIGAVYKTAGSQANLGVGVAVNAWNQTQVLMYGETGTLATALQVLSMPFYLVFLFFNPIFI